MDEDLTQELDRLTAELSAAETELIRLTARISGLRAQRETLATAVARQRSVEDAQAVDEPLRLDIYKKRTEAIEALLRHSERAMSIDEVCDALNESWNTQSGYAVVASTLNLLERTGRVTKVARGRYAGAA
jgi:chromosome segregation ATPase